MRELDVSFNGFFSSQESDVVLSKGEFFCFFLRRILFRTSPQKGLASIFSNLEDNTFASSTRRHFMHCGMSSGPDVCSHGKMVMQGTIFHFHDHFIV